MAPSPVLCAFLGMMTGAMVVSFGLVASHKKRSRASAGRSRDAAVASAEFDTRILLGPLIADDATQLIGKTPLVRLNRVTEGCGATILPESMEPCSSMKDRIGLGLIEGVERRGQITRGVTTLIECTSGNTGIAMAIVAAVLFRGYETVIVMPDGMLIESSVLLKALGAKLLMNRSSKGYAGVLEKTEAIAAELGENAFLLNQFGNPDNPKVQTSGERDAFVAGVGTGGTVTGSAQFFKVVKPSIKAYANLEICAVEPQESAVLSGGPAGPHTIQGLGARVVPDNYDASLIDMVLTVSTEDAIAMARELAMKEGLLVGISAGAAVQAALNLEKQQEMKGKTICVIIPSSGERYSLYRRYLSTVLFSDLLEEARKQKVEE